MRHGILLGPGHLVPCLYSKGGRREAHAVDVDPVALAGCSLIAGLDRALRLGPGRLAIARVGGITLQALARSGIGRAGLAIAVAVAIAVGALGPGCSAAEQQAGGGDRGGQA